MDTVRVIEVGPRDGLQNEPTPVPLAAKIRFIKALRAAGLREIEATSFVSPKWVPQLGDAADLWPLLPAGPLYSALVPNMRGLERALGLGVSRISVFTAASESFVKANINMTIAESLTQFAEIIKTSRETWQTQLASRPDPECVTDVIRRVASGRPSDGVQPDAEGVTEFSRCVASGRPPDSVENGNAPGGVADLRHPWIRGYVSTAFECPYEGRITPAQVIPVCHSLLAMGVDEVSIGDTIGVASPAEVRTLGREILREFGANQAHKFAWHFHDTWGTGLANVSAALDLGFRSFDASAGGLGGCPYAPGAGGNLATEDLIYLLERSGLETGVDLDLLAQASLEILVLLEKSPTARAQVAALGRASAC